jgi:hypothetical protein
MAQPKDAPRFRISLQRLALIFSVMLTASTLLVCLTLKGLTRESSYRLQRLTQAADARQAVFHTRIHLLEFSRISELILTTHDDDALEQRRVDAMAKALTYLATLRSSVEPAQLPTVDKAEEQVRAYFAVRHRVELAGAGPERALVAVTPALDAAGATLLDLADTQYGRMAREFATALAWTRFADLVGWAVAGLVVLGSVVGLAALYWTGMRPVLRLTDSIRRFGRGEREIRAGTSAALEVSSAACTFNEMADTMTLHQTRMLDFLASVANDLRNPVDVISTTLDGLGPDKPLPTPEIVQTRIYEGEWRADPSAQAYQPVPRCEPRRVAETEPPTATARPLRGAGRRREDLRDIFHRP